MKLPWVCFLVAGPLTWSCILWTPLAVSMDGKQAEGSRGLHRGGQDVGDGICRVRPSWGSPTPMASTCHVAPLWAKLHNMSPLSIER